MASNETYPIALAHGIARFDFLRESFKQKSQRLFGKVFDDVVEHLMRHGVKLDRLHYFRGILSHLEADGFDVHHTTVSYAKSLETRAGDLRDQIEGILKKTGAVKAHVIAHSMGGLDARCMIARAGMSGRIASLTTIGTPHHGSSFADFMLDERAGNELIALVGRAIDLRGFKDLSSAACAKFNESVREAEAASDVFYQTYSSSEARKQVFTFLQPSFDVIERAEGANDGLVSVASQKWQAEIIGSAGRVKQIVQKDFPLAADHLNQVGWWDLNEIHGAGALGGLGARDEYEDAVRNVYLDIARDLRARFPVAK
ncbi:MAG TPA: alpha/beta fold hydrolase [Pyrinomonadaceae bacterium]|nr:alpha/beta fold hydrolase [Pyrinomonadaceae bacterium]